MPDFDVVVVGGGCAGLWAARTAASEGARTLLVERMGEVGERILCAEGVGAAGIGQFTDLSPDCVAASIDGGKFYDPGGGCIEIEEPRCGYVLHKRLFLRDLSLEADRAGAELRMGAEAVSVRPASAGGLEIALEGAAGCAVVTAGAVVAADGIESAIGRQLGIQRALKPLEVFSCAQYLLSPVEVDPHKVEFHFGREVAPGGYAWVFPKGEDVANVGVGVICSGSIEATPLEYLRRFKARRCPGAKILGRVFGGVPTARAPFEAHGHSVFLAGDAGRMADPVSGAGIVPGMASARAAAVAAARCARDGSEARSATRVFKKDLKALFKDRSVRFAVRKVLVGMSDKEATDMLRLMGEYASKRSILKGDPFNIMGFLVKAMPRTFGLVRHLVRS